MEPSSALRSRLVGSPCCLPSLGRREVFRAYREIGFTQFEAFSSWATARHEWTTDPVGDRAEAADFGLRITSYHLPMIERDIDTGLARALAAARYASRLGDGVAVLFKAESIDLYARTTTRFLDALEHEQIGVVPVLQNHAGTAISSLKDFSEVLGAIDDPRMNAILEVGHFQRVGVHWREGWDLLDGRIALVHLNDIRGGRSVPFGTGDVDIAGLIGQIKQTSYRGNIVVELELETHATNPQITLEGLRNATNLLCRLYDVA